MDKIRLLADLFFTFMKIGGFTVGGGYAMIPIIQHEIVDVKKWATEEEVVDYFTISQSLPGVIGINTATCIGKKTAGILGSFVATLGMVLPSFIIICIIATVFDRFQELVYVQRAFRGVRAAVVSLIFVAVIRIFQTSVKDKFQIFIFITAFISIFFLGIMPQYMILFGAAAATLYIYIDGRRQFKKRKLPK